MVRLAMMTLGLSVQTPYGTPPSLAADIPFPINTTSSRPFVAPLSVTSLDLMYRVFVSRYVPGAMLMVVPGVALLTARWRSASVETDTRTFPVTPSGGAVSMPAAWTEANDASTSRTEQVIRYAYVRTDQYVSKGFLLLNWTGS